jgi:hypothetical protein
MKRQAARTQVSHDTGAPLTEYDDVVRVLMVLKSLGRLYLHKRIDCPPDRYKSAVESLWVLNEVRNRCQRPCFG